MCSSTTSDEGVVVVCAVVLPVMRSGCCVCSSTTSDEWLLCVQ